MRWARPGDVFIGITTSGRSPNVVAAAKAAKSLGLSTVSLTGGGPSPLSEICDIHLRVPSNVTARVQEAHILMCHVACELVDELLFPEGQPQSAFERLAAAEVHDARGSAGSAGSVAEARAQSGLDKRLL